MTRIGNISMWVLVNLCRFLVVAAFIFSSIVKIIDPRGTEYKIQDYGEAFGFSHLLPSYVPLALAVLLAFVEFRIGINTFFGIYRRLTSRFTLFFMLLVTPLTLYIAIKEPVHDCGCFGDAIYLTGWQTFYKNVVLLAAVLILVVFPSRMTRFISEYNQWLINIYSTVFAFILAGYSIYRLPVIDFRPFHVGADIIENMQPQGEVTYETTFLLEKDGQQQWFSLEEYPDSTWTFIDSKTEAHGEAKEPLIDNFQMVTYPRGEDITEAFLLEDGYKFLLVAPYLELADDSYMDVYDRMYEYAQDHGYPFYCLTASSKLEILRWQDMTGAEYPFCYTDGVTLKTMVRSNPGLLLLQGSTVMGKWPCTDLPDIDDPEKPLEEQVWSHDQQSTYMERAFRLFLWFIVPLFIITLLDRLWLGQRLLKTYYSKRKKHNILLNRLKVKKDNEKENCCR